MQRFPLLFERHSVVQRPAIGDFRDFSPKLKLVQLCSSQHLAAAASHVFLVIRHQYKRSKLHNSASHNRSCCINHMRPAAAQPFQVLTQHQWDLVWISN